jgi:hypothetical protein
MIRYVARMFLCVTLTCGSMACTPTLVGPTGPSKYFFSLVVLSNQIFLVVNPMSTPGSLPDATHVFVRVQNAQEQPVDGVPVEFQVEPNWTQNASLTPQRVVTRGGAASALFRATTTGKVRIMVRVEDMTQETSIAVSPQPSPPGGI